MNVPVNVDTNVKVLPRVLTDSNMIHVRLARKMEYVKDYLSGVVRPKLLYDAAKKFVSKPLCLEEGIQLSNNWYYEEGEAPDLENDFYTENQIYETMLTNDNGVNLLEKGIRFAPAEGYKPTSVLFDPNCEFMAFPKVFAGFKMEPKHNGKDISYSDFAKSMAMRYDRRVAQRGDLLLFMAKKLELTKICNNISICLRKKKLAHGSVTAGDLLQTSYVANLLAVNDGFKILRGVRNSPAHWQNEKKKILAMIRQFDLPTLFLTLSSADIQWPELLVALK